MTSSAGKRLLCPSAECAPGNQLIGIVGRAGTVDLLAQPITLDDRFVSLARIGRRPEQRFRFATPCIAKGCAHWSGSRCGVSDEVVEALGHDAEGAALPACGIRNACRWYDQDGATACSACPQVVREIIEPAVPAADQKL